jgi:hypothetical protein
MTELELINIVFLFLDADIRYGFAYNNQTPFTTYDMLNGNCAEERHGAWWYSGCTYINLNGYYATPGTLCEIPGAVKGNCGHWHYGIDKLLSLRTSSMMLRRK